MIIRKRTFSWERRSWCIASYAMAPALTTNSWEAWCCTLKHHQSLPSIPWQPGPDKGAELDTGHCPWEGLWVRLQQHPVTGQLFLTVWSQGGGKRSPEQPPVPVEVTFVMTLAPITAITPAGKESPRDLPSVSFLFTLKNYSRES
jgi:hypothetical protein